MPSVVFVLDAKRRVSHVAGLLSDDRLGGLVRAAVTASLWTEVLDLVIHLDRRLLKRLAALPEVDDPAVLDPLVRAAVAEGVSEELLPLVELLPEPGRARVVAALPAR